VVPFRQREQLEPLLADIEAYAAEPALADRDVLLIHAAGQLWRFREELTREPAKMQAVLQTLRVLRDASGAGKCSAEEEIMKHLVAVACECVGWLQRGRVTREGYRTGGPEALKPKLQPLGAVLDILVEFARECFAYSRPHDNFGGKRRSLAFEILGMAGEMLDLPDVVALARQAVKKGRADALGAIGFLEQCLGARKESPDGGMRAALLAYAKRTRRRGLAVAALNMLVETGAIGEGEACDRMDDWKSEHWGRR
jgi:hypothetical protein